MSAFVKDGIQQLYVPRRVGRPVQRSTGTSSVKVRDRMKRMLVDLKADRAWDLLDAVTATPPRLSLKDLYDAHVARDLAGLRERLNALDLEPLVERWLASKRAELGDTGVPEMYERQVRTLIPAGVPFASSELTPARVSAWLSSLNVTTGTRRSYYSAISSFVDYCLTVGAIAHSPLERIKRPKKNAARERWLYEADALKLVEASPGVYRVLEAIVQGTGAEIGGVLAWRRNPSGMLRRDVDLDRGVLFVRGSKQGTRARWCIIRPWARPIIAEYVKGMLPNAPLFDGITRHMMHDHHDRTCAAIGIDDYTVHDGMHTWAVNARFRGISLEDIAEQRGHKGINSTLMYAKFKPTLEERQQREAK